MNISSNGKPTAQTAGSTDEGLIEFANAQQQYISSYIVLADTKCAWAFAISAGLIAYLLTNSGSSPILSTDASLASRCVGFVALVSLIFSAVFSFLGIAPRLRSTRSDDPFFFGTVASHRTSGHFVDQVTGFMPNELPAIRLRHNYDISRVCTRKYFFVRSSLWTGFFGACCVGLALALNV